MLLWLLPENVREYRHPQVPIIRSLSGWSRYIDFKIYTQFTPHNMFEIEHEEYCGSYANMQVRYTKKWRFVKPVDVRKTDTFELHPVERAQEASTSTIGNIEYHRLSVVRVR